MERITGAQARELLDDFNNPRTFLGHVRTRPLLETLAWLYGREPDEAHGDHTVTWKPGSRYAAIEVDACLEPGEKVQLSSSEMGDEWLTMHADEAVDLARALLAAAEMARTM